MSDRCGVVVIKDDLKFAGQRVKIVSQGKLQIDCEFEGDVTGTEVVISEQAKGWLAFGQATLTPLALSHGSTTGQTAADFEAVLGL